MTTYMDLKPYNLNWYCHGCYKEIIKLEAKHTTNKGMLPEALFDEMREAFKRSEEFLDLELKEEDPLLKQKEDLHSMIEKATPEQMQKILTMLCEVSV